MVTACAHRARLVPPASATARVRLVACRDRVRADQPLCRPV